MRADGPRWDDWILSSSRTLEGGSRRARTPDGESVYFVPSPLLRELAYSGPLVEALSQADTQLGRLSSLGESLPNPNLLISPYLRVEAVLSSAIEGTQASLSDVFLEEAGAEQGDRPPDTREVVNHVRALHHGIDRLRTRPLDVHMLRAIHRVLMTDVRGGDERPGDFRTEQNWIGPPGCYLSDAVYVPPAPRAMEACLTDLQHYLDEPPALPNLIQAALLHYQFQAIHPFRDGNGRVGRLMIVLFLMARKSLSHPLLYLSRYFEQHRKNYYEHLRVVSESGQYEEWLIFFLRGVAQQSEDAVTRARRLVNLRETYRQKLTDDDAPANALILLDNLLANPYVTIPHAVEILGVTFPTAQRAIEQFLVPAGILTEFTGQQRYRRFRAWKPSNRDRHSPPLKDPH